MQKDEVTESSDSGVGVARDLSEVAVRIGTLIELDSESEQIDKSVADEPHVTKSSTPKQSGRSRRKDSKSTERDKKSTKRDKGGDGKAGFEQGVELRSVHGSQSYGIDESIGDDVEQGKSSPTRKKQRAKDVTNPSLDNEEIQSNDDDNDSSRPGPSNIFLRCLVHGLRLFFEILGSSWLNFSLAVVPFTWLCYFFNWPKEALFVLCLIAFVGFASVMRLITDQLNAHLPTKIQPFFRLQWVLPLIISVFALTHGIIRMAQTVIVGSILFRLTVTNGVGYLCTWSRVKMRDENLDVKQGVSLVLVALFCLFVPHLLVVSIGEAPSEAGMVRLTRWTAILMLALGGSLYYVYSYKTHTSSTKFWREVDKGDIIDMGLVSSIITLIVVIVLICLQSALFASSVERVNDTWGLTFTFITMVLLSIVLNAVHVADALRLTFETSKALQSMVMSSCRDILELVLVAMPLVVIISWIANIAFPLHFYPLESITTWLSALVLHLITGSRGNALLGGLILLTYLALSVAFYYHPEG